MRDIGPPALGDRVSGVLLHPTSLPGVHGIGDLGEAARRFVDFLAAAQQRLWQMLPLGPIGYGDSPYSAASTFAGNPLLLDLHELARDGLLSADDVDAIELPRDRVDYAKVASFKAPRVARAAAVFAARIAASAGERARFEAFCEAERGWLDDFAIFTAEKRASGGASWTSWDPALRRRTPAGLARARSARATDIAAVRFEQYAFARQLASLRAYAASRGVGLVGDVPIFVAHDSADVWQHQELFKLDANGWPRVVAGVPPDYFSRTGQRWGNPVYAWETAAGECFRFWIQRMRKALEWASAVRLDHFIGFVRAWEIPAEEVTAVHGAYVPGPGERLFVALRDALGTRLPFIAEDLGAVTPQVHALRDRLGLPGMRVLQFAFGDDVSAPSFLPHAYTRRTVAYTGTHDNDTARGWFDDPGGPDSARTPDQAARERAFAKAYLATDGHEIHWDMIRAVLASVADTAVVPLQDVLGLGREARMNRPGTREGNWTWRFREESLSDGVVTRLGDMTRVYGRSITPAAGRHAPPIPPHAGNGGRGHGLVP